MILSIDIERLCFVLMIKDRDCPDVLNIDIKTVMCLYLLEKKNCSLNPMVRIKEYSVRSSCNVNQRCAGNKVVLDCNQPFENNLHDATYWWT